MCGIVGYVGKNNAVPILLDGLKRLEYRGYDSAGVAVVVGNIISEIKSVGRIKNLEEKINGSVESFCGIAHTRWATHGLPTEANAHPHADCTGKIRIVHNGIIENYQQLKAHLMQEGHIFVSETDTEVIAHLIETFYTGDIFVAVNKTLPLLQGTYGLVVLSQDEPETLIVAKRGSPLVIGLAETETIVASDVSAILRYTKKVIYLEDNEVAVVNKDNVSIFNADLNKIEKPLEYIEWTLDQAEKSGHEHFMHKEIFEQPESIRNSLRGRYIIKNGLAVLGGLDGVANKLRQVEHLTIVACGTARNAGLVGEYMLEEFAGMPTEVDYASEFRYRQPILDKASAVLAVSQSGETADTLAAIKEAKEKNILTLGVVNVVGSSIARLTDAGVYNHIGPEMAVASTKAFVSQLAIFALLTVKLGRQRQMSLATGQQILKELELLPAKVALILLQDEAIKTIAQKYCEATNFAFLGRKYNYPVAIEGAIKLKEVSYIHAEGFAAGELKHGPIAMIDENFPSIFIVPQDSVYEKNISNLLEIKARNGKIIAIATEGDNDIAKIADEVIFIPKTLEMLTPILSVIPLQLFAYHVAVLKGLDVDKPRNLAKSVTVE
ncbi:MAG: glutamine--fructose-6-phosphate transaminase (isomerizing) [Candidatus Falkowbacteria bacterium]